MQFSKDCEALLEEVYELEQGFTARRNALKDGQKKKVILLTLRQAVEESFKKHWPEALGASLGTSGLAALIGASPLAIAVPALGGGASVLFSQATLELGTVLVKDSYSNSEKERTVLNDAANECKSLRALVEDYTLSHDEPTATTASKLQEFKLKLHKIKTDTVGLGPSSDFVRKTRKKPTLTPAPASNNPSRASGSALLDHASKRAEETEKWTKGHAEKYHDLVRSTYLYSSAVAVTGGVLITQVAEKVLKMPTPLSMAAGALAAFGIGTLIRYREATHTEYGWRAKLYTDTYSEAGKLRIEIDKSKALELSEVAKYEHFWTYRTQLQKLIDACNSQWNGKHDEEVKRRMT